jgi:hypothetical protein
MAPAYHAQCSVLYLYWMAGGQVSSLLLVGLSFSFSGFYRFRFLSAIYIEFSLEVLEIVLGQPPHSFGWLSCPVPPGRRFRPFKAWCGHVPVRGYKGVMDGWIGTPCSQFLLLP